MIGEAHADAIENSPFYVDNECTSNEELYSNYTLPRCLDPTGRVVVPILLGVFVVLLDILLINLLIAIFTDVINNKQVTISHWAFERFEQILEFRGRRSVVPPLTIIYYIYWSVHWTLKLLRRRRRRGSETEEVPKTDYRVPLRACQEKRYDTMLRAWMCEMRDEWVKAEELRSTREAEYQLEKLRLRQKEIMRDLRTLVNESKKKEKKHH